MEIDEIRSFEDEIAFFGLSPVSFVDNSLVILCLLASASFG
jgi:hypothetical protein